MKPNIALTIAGSDPSGGAGIQADLKTFHQFGVYGEAVITLLTVQNTSRVSEVSVLHSDFVERQLDAVLEDIPPDAIKTGALGNSKVISAVAKALSQSKVPLVVDPVMVSKHGAQLLDDASIETAVRELFPIAALITPNIPEAVAIIKVAAGKTVPTATLTDLENIAFALSDLGPGAVLVKGGHRKDFADDLLLWKGELRWFKQEILQTKNTHGTGCTLSAAITALLSQGTELDEAVFQAKKFITAAISSAPEIGHGIGPVNHFAATRSRPTDEK